MADAKWRRALRDRLHDRPDLGKEGLYETYWAKHALMKNDVIEALNVIELEYDIAPGMLRPGDKLAVLFQPTPTRNPWQWLHHQVWAGDREAELTLQLRRRLEKHGVGKLWPHVETIDDFVRAWCGKGPAD